ncbi:hypothetical protein HanPI659440_Chr03g0126981 [Helianthus annuus]|nr:hypothetical protein HanPI659440_Chr03g0126981 [Helianthus annuus]
MFLCQNFSLVKPMNPHAAMVQKSMIGILSFSAASMVLVKVMKPSQMIQVTGFSSPDTTSRKQSKKLVVR